MSEREAVKKKAANEKVMNEKMVNEKAENTADHGSKREGGAISCEIIRDLLPLYAEEICSEATRELVQEHIKRCNACGLLAEKIKDTELVIAADKGAEEEQIDFLRKLKTHILGQKLLVFGMLVLLIAGGMGVVISRNGAVPVEMYYLILPVLTVSAALLLSDCTGKNVWTGDKRLMLTITGVLVCATVLLEILPPEWILAAGDRMKLPQERTGPILYMGLTAAAFVHTVCFAAALYRNIKTGNSYGAVTVVSILGGCLALSFVSQLKRLDSIEAFREARNAALLLLLAQGTILLLAWLLLERRRLNKS